MIVRLCAEILAEAILNAHGRLRILPLFKDGFATDHAARTALEATSIVKNRLVAFSGHLVKSCRAAHNQLLEFRIGSLNAFLNLDMSVFFVDLKLVEGKLLVDVNSDVDHSAFTPFMATLASLNRP